jgi:Ca2+-binding EF-hand superfamily protein
MGCCGSKSKLLQVGLSQDDIEFLRSRTQFDETTIRKWHKGFEKDCPNGRLTLVKFVDIYTSSFPSGNAEQFCGHVFRTFDADKNGYIDFKEFLVTLNLTSSGTAGTGFTKSLAGF